MTVDGCPWTDHVLNIFPALELISTILPFASTGVHQVLLSKSASFQLRPSWLAGEGWRHSHACTGVQSSWHCALALCWNLNWAAHEQFSVHYTKDCKQAGRVIYLLQKQHAFFFFFFFISDFFLHKQELHAITGVVSIFFRFIEFTYTSEATQYIKHW